MKQNPKLTVFFDGLCSVCSPEIAWYRRHDRQGEILFKDITDPGFNAATEGLDPHEVNTVFHARKPDGTLLLGVDAFLEIWNILPRFKMLARLGRVGPLKKILNVGYAGFVIVRPYLPRKKRSVCATRF